MTKREIFRNKNMLGFLTISELRQVARIEEMSLGEHWVPVFVRAGGNKVRFSMSTYGNDPEVEVPADQVVRVHGRIAKMSVKETNILCSHQLSGTVEARLMLERDPFPGSKVSGGVV